MHNKRNSCVYLLRKTKIKYYANHNEKEIKDDEKFWKVVTFLFWSGDKINLTENDEQVKTEMKTTD